MIERPGNSNPIRNQRGVVLLLCIFALLLVTGIALTLLAMSDTETKVGANYRESQKAYFSALGGIQEARVRLLTDSSVVPSGMPSNTNPNGVVYILNSNGSDTIQPWTLPTLSNGTYYDDELCHEFFPGLTAIYGSNDNSGVPNLPCANTPGSSGWYKTVTSTDPNTGTSAALDYKWVRITAKENRSAYPYNVASSTYNSTATTPIPICWDGTKELPLPAGMTACNDHSTGKYYESVYRVASLARTSAGARKMLIAEVAKTPPLMTNSAVDSQDHVTLNGQLTVNGFDSCSCNLNYGKNGYDLSSCTATTTGGVTTYSCPGRGSQSCDNTKYAIYASGTVDSSTPSETLVAGPNPAVVQNQPWTYDISTLINQYSQGAVNVTGAPYNWSCSPPSTSYPNGTCGTQSSATLGVPPPFPPTYNSDGSLNTTGVSPAPSTQVTYVPGDLQLSGGSVGSGILIVNGDLNIHGGLQFYGLILVKGVIKFTGGGSNSTNIIGAVLAGQESYVDNTLGGSAVIDFNSCALKQGQTPQPPHLVSIRVASY